jgi:hypothetical protein
VSAAASAPVTACSPFWLLLLLLLLLVVLVGISLLAFSRLQGVGKAGHWLPLPPPAACSGQRGQVGHQGEDPLLLLLLLLAGLLLSSPCAAV